MNTTAMIRKANRRGVAAISMLGLLLVAGSAGLYAIDVTYTGTSTGGNTSWGNQFSWTPTGVPDGTQYDVYLGFTDTGNRAVQNNSALNRTVGSLFFANSTATDFVYSVLLSSSGNLNIANNLSVSASSVIVPQITTSGVGTGKVYVGVPTTGDTNMWLNNSTKTFRLSSSSVFANTVSGDRTWIIGGSGNWNFASTTDNTVLVATSIGSELTGGKKAILRKEGTGTLTISSSNSFVGQVDVAGGSLVVGNSRALGDVSNAVNVTSGTLSMGAVTGTVGTLTVDGGSVMASSGAINAAAVAAKSGTIGAAITGTGALTKTTAGTSTLTQANTYSGGTLISAGTLVLTGAGSVGSGNVMMDGGELDISGISASGYTLGSGQTIGGSGTVDATGKTLTVNGVIVPVDLAIEGGVLALTATTTYTFTLTAPGASSAVTLQGGAQLNIGSGLMGFSDFTFLPTIGFTGGTYVLFSGAADLLGSLDNSDLTGLVGGQNATLGLLGDDIILDVAAVPEPSTFVLIGVGVVGLVFMRRRTSRV